MNNKILNERKRVNSEENQQTQTAAALRARSVARDYQLFVETQNSWRKNEQEIRKKQQTSECTFKPDIKSSSKKFKGSTTYLSNYYVTSDVPNTTARQKQVNDLDDGRQATPKAKVAFEDLGKLSRFD